MSHDPVQLLVRFDLLDDARATAFDALLAAALPAVAAEEGTERYEVRRVRGEPLARVVVSRYRDGAAKRAHDAAPAMAALISALPGLAATVRVEELTDAPLDPAPEGRP